MTKYICVGAFCGLLFFVALGHVSYQILLHRLRKWKLPVNMKSPGMGFEKNLKTYLRSRKDDIFSDSLFCMWFTKNLEELPFRNFS